MRIIPAAIVLTLAAFGQHVLADPFEHELRRICDDVYVAVRPDVNRVPVSGNVTLIINEADVVVVDSGRTPAAAENIIALLREKTSKPVSTLINTHWHDDHHLGNSVWKQHWPGIEIIAHVNTHEAISGEPMAGLDTREEGLRRTEKALAERVATGLDDDGHKLSDEEVARTRDILETIPLLIEQSRITELVVPDRTYSDQLQLDRPGRRIQLRYLGRGNTDGDTVVYLPDDGIVITGDLVVMPLPFGFYSYPTDWVRTLEGIKSLDWTTLVPGHGEPQVDSAYIDALVALLKSVRTQVMASHANGMTLDEARAAIDLNGLKKSFTGGDVILERLFHAYWIIPITKSMWKEANGVEIVQGIDPV